MNICIKCRWPGKNTELNVNEIIYLKCYNRKQDTIEKIVLHKK
jgi:hypothetical protein